MRYVDCTVTIKDLESVSIEYVVGDVKNKDNGKLGLDPFTKMSVERLNHWINFALKYQEERPGTANPCQVADLQVIGLNLYRILFGHPEEGIGAAFASAYADFEQQSAKEGALDMRLRLRLVFETPAKELGNLPWEFLYIPQGKDDIEQGFFFAGDKTDLILTRCVPESPLIKEMLKQPPKSERLRILVVISSPIGDGLMTKIDEQECKSVVDQIRTIKGADVDQPLGNPTVQDLGKAIRDRKPHIVHFIGHGREGELALVKAKDEEDFDEGRPDDPQPRWVSSKAFKNLFTKPKPRLIFLHACKGAAATSQEGFSCIARGLAYAEIPAVVAMQYNISNRDAGRFARKFYEQLALGRDIDEAVKEGRWELGQVFPQWAHPRFGTPVVYLQTNYPIVLPSNVEETKGEEVTEGEEFSRGSSRVGTSVAAVAATVEALGVAPQPPPGLAQPAGPSSGIRR